MELFSKEFVRQTTFQIWKRKNIKKRLTKYLMIQTKLFHQLENNKRKINYGLIIFFLNFNRNQSRIRKKKCRQEIKNIETSKTEYFDLIKLKHFPVELMLLMINNQKQHILDPKQNTQKKAKIKTHHFFHLRKATSIIKCNKRKVDFKQCKSSQSGILR